MRNICNDDDLKLDVVANMKGYGGSFIKALAECILRADPINLFKINTTFEDYISNYHPDNWGKIKEL